MAILLSCVLEIQNREAELDISFIGLLTIVAYQSLSVDTLPQISYFTLINGFVYVGYITMAAMVIMNIRIFLLQRRGEAGVAASLDRVSRWAFPMAFIILNLASGFYFYMT